ncbi:hypothetical protein ACOSQ3_032480 [Xanthoceras sorbifolium]
MIQYLRISFVGKLDKKNKSSKFFYIILLFLSCRYPLSFNLPEQPGRMENLVEKPRRMEKLLEKSSSWDILECCGDL